MIYARTFSALSNQSPLSDAGVWAPNGSDWTPVNVTSGLAFGTQNGSGAFDDSVQYLALPFAARGSQMARGVISLSAGVTATFLECEIHLRGHTNGSTVSRGYECNLAHDGAYTDIVRWNGALGDFTILSHKTVGVPVPTTGGIFQATITNGVIEVFYNGVQINTFTDTTWTDGSPGLGFYLEGSTSNLNKFAFSSYFATDFTEPMLYQDL